MNVLFLTMSSSVENIEEIGIYTDLVRKFSAEGHNLYVMFPKERRLNQNTALNVKDNIHLLGVKTLNVTKTNIIEKGLGQLLLEKQFVNAFDMHFREVKIDLILYSTPPITFTKVISHIKRKNPTAHSYLLLKDIFPQNAVDLGMMTKSGLKGILYRFFRKKEKELYQISDYIGCMSPANVSYVLDHNPELSSLNVEIAPNSYDIVDYSLDTTNYALVRKKYSIPLDKPVFIYGGNMGKPQGIPFLLECLKAVQNREDCHFVIIGDGTEYPKLESWYNEAKPKSVSLFRHIPKNEYDKLTEACDIGLIFLDWRFTIPNYPSRLLPYLMKRKPIIAVTDSNCDVGYFAEQNGYGFWSPSNSVESFVKTVDLMLSSDMKQMGDNGYEFFLNNYTVQHTYDAVMKHFS